MRVPVELPDGSHHHRVSCQSAKETNVFSESESPNSGTVLDTQKGSNARYVPFQSALPETGVSVKRAEAEFAELNREFSHLSQQNQKLSRTTSRRSNLKEKDVEKTATSETENEPFDLEETLRGNRAQDVQHGIKSKRVGVLWEDLTVSGIGGARNIVKTFPQGNYCVLLRVTMKLLTNVHVSLHRFLQYSRDFD